MKNVAQNSSELSLKLLRLFEKNNSKVISEKSRTIWKTIFIETRKKLVDLNTFDSILNIDENFRKKIAEIVRKAMLSSCSKQIEILERKQRMIKRKMSIFDNNDKNGNYNNLIREFNKIERDKKLYCNSKDEWHAFNLAFTSFCLV